jgi:hypothetical protein
MHGHTNIKCTDCSLQSIDPDFRQLKFKKEKQLDLKIKMKLCDMHEWIKQSDFLDYRMQNYSDR